MDGSTSSDVIENNKNLHAVISRVVSQLMPPLEEDKSVTDEEKEVRRHREDTFEKTTDNAAIILTEIVSQNANLINDPKKLATLASYEILRLQPDNEIANPHEEMKLETAETLRAYAREEAGLAARGVNDELIIYGIRSPEIFGKYKSFKKGLKDNLIDGFTEYEGELIKAIDLDNQANSLKEVSSIGNMLNQAGVSDADVGRLAMRKPQIENGVSLNV